MADKNKKNKNKEEETVIEHEEAPQWRQVLGQAGTFFKGNARNQAMLLIALAGSMALSAVLLLWSQTNDWQPLYGNQEMYDASSISEVLEVQGIEYRIHPSSGQIMVDASKISEARMQVSAAGVKASLPDGLKLLDKDQSLGTSQFMENARYRFGLEGELAKTVISLKAVRNARVHLALPKRSAFVRQQEKSSASVFVDLFAGSRLDDKQVEAIVNLVAGSVPGLERSDVSVVDQQGNLLSRDISLNNGLMAQANTQMQYLKSLEQHYIERVNTLLDPILGSSNFRVQVSAAVGFDRIEQTAEEFDPENRTVRSEQGRERLNAASDAGGIPGTLSNQPPITTPDETAPETEVTQNEYTRNYELNRTVRHTSYQQGQLQRLSVAVVINNSPEAVAVIGEWNQAKLDGMQNLIRDAVGFSAERQDQVTIHTASFLPVPETEFSAPSWWQQPETMTYAKYGTSILLGLAVIIFLLRPLVNKTLAVTQENQGEAISLEHQQEKSNRVGIEHPAFLDESTALLPPELADFDTQLSHLRKLAVKEPDRVAQVVKLWMKSDNNS